MLQEENYWTGNTYIWPWVMGEGYKYSMKSYNTARAGCYISKGKTKDG